MHSVSPFLRRSSSAMRLSMRVRHAPERRDPIVSGVHESGESHYELLRAFVDSGTLREMSRALNESGYRSHEFGDSVLVGA